MQFPRDIHAAPFTLAPSIQQVIASVSALLGEGKFEQCWSVICRDERVRVDVRSGVVVVEITGPDPGPVRFVEVRTGAQLDLLMDYLRHKCLAPTG